MLKFALLASLSMGMATAVHAEATDTGPVIVSPAGKVLVNQGKGFVPAADGLALNFNDRIMVGKDGAVTLAYAKCSVVLKPSTLLTLPKGDLCGKTTVAALQNSEAVKIQPVAVSQMGRVTPYTFPTLTGLVFAGITGAIAAENLATQSGVSKP